METPLGLFYVAAKYDPRDAFLGPFAFETSAYSRLSDWPGGGIVGIHGTSMPQLLGQAVSHGCVRVSNRTILLARHGESDWNTENRWQGHADRPLTERGRRQAEALADRLGHIQLDAVY